ncbi:MAG: O-sialoglycoprotein endopeptidase [Clostridiaceae bacterium]|nr:O-sialoglycoprotein endopeptidase [Clostridiaceae bacterium]
MTKEKVILGIDTSNYTTSVALMNRQGKLIKEEKKMLFVKEGNLGLRQSEALFQHIKNLPLLTKEMQSISSNYEIVAISSATKPRPIEDSYMPVFLASKSLGETISNLWNIPFYEFSHQEGHIEAGLWSIALKLDKPFLALHISGGTTEILKVVPKSKGYHIEIIGGTGDISAGQFIDRIGVSLDLPFPSGPHLEGLCEDTVIDNIHVPISVKGTSISFSGPETYVQKMIREKNLEAKEVAYSVFSCVARTLNKLIKNTLQLYELDTLLVVGGVASNNIIKNFLKDNLQGDGIEVHFGQPKYCSDNAVGIAALGLESFLEYEYNKKLGD